MGGGCEWGGSVAAQGCTVMTSWGQLLGLSCSTQRWRRWGVPGGCDSTTALLAYIMFLCKKLSGTGLRTTHQSTFLTSVAPLWTHQPAGWVQGLAAEHGRLAHKVIGMDVSVLNPLA